MDHYGIATPLTPYHEHNAASARPKMLARLAAGEAVALVSDAGTPLISDPGYKLVRAAHEAGHAVTALPGASARSGRADRCRTCRPTGFSSKAFCRRKPRSAARASREIARIPATLVLFESGPRLADALADLAEGFGEREAAVCRELTKLHEEVRRGALRKLAQDYAQGAETRGEIVIVIAPPDESERRQKQASRRHHPQCAEARVGEGCRRAKIADRTGVPRREVYQRALELPKRR